jgi:hypothetical protein
LSNGWRQNSSKTRVKILKNGGKREAKVQKVGLIIIIIIIVIIIIIIIVIIIKEVDK